MSALTLTIVLIAIVAVLGVIAGMLLANRPPSTDYDDYNDLRPDGDGESRTERLHESVDRPAGPAAEPMTPDRLGGDQSPPAPG